MMIPITSSETMANRKNTDDEIPAPRHDGASGRTAKPVKMETKIMRGAALKSGDTALVGMMSSFCKAFKKSALLYIMNLLLIKKDLVF